MSSLAITIIASLIIIGATFAWKLGKVSLGMAGGVVVSVIALLLLIPWIGSWGNDDPDEETAEEMYIPPAPPPPVCVVGQRLFERLPKTGLPVYLRQGWSTSPLKGPIKVIDPNGREFSDVPGEHKELGWVPEGWYFVFPSPPDSERGVLIFNCWGNPPPQ